MGLSYRCFKIIISLALIISVIFNIILCIRNLPETRDLLIIWSVILLIGILFLIFFAKKDIAKKKYARKTSKKRV